MNTIFTNKNFIMKKILVPILLLAIAIAVPSLIVTLNANNFYPPEVTDCEDLGETDLPCDLMLGDLISPGLTVDTSCGLCFLGYSLNCFYDSMTDDYCYYCEFVGVFGPRCYLIQTNCLF